MNELYDLKEDPFELNNLINVNDYENIRKRIKGRLKCWRERITNNKTSKMIRGRRLKR